MARAGLMAVGLIERFESAGATRCSTRNVFISTTMSNWSCPEKVTTKKITLLTPPLPPPRSSVTVRPDRPLHDLVMFKKPTKAKAIRRKIETDDADDQPEGE